MRVAQWIFLLAGFSGVIMIAPLYFEERYFEDYPPASNRPEFYFGFAGLCMAWQVMFIMIGLAPVRYRMAMLPSMSEKASFAFVIPILYAQDRVAPIWLGFASMDATWFVLFIIAFLRTPNENLATPNRED